MKKHHYYISIIEKTRTINTSKLYPLTYKVLNSVIPKMEKATAYLTKRDIDNDYLLEQDHNEDWMDSIMRIGKIVYSNATWILALKNFSKLLKRLDNLSSSSSRKSEKYHNDKAAKIPSRKIEKLADNVTLAVEQKLWSEEDGSYI